MPVDHAVTVPMGDHRAHFMIREGEILGETLRAGTVWDGPGFLQVVAREHAGLGQAGQVVLDVGANQGFFTHWLVSQGAWRVVAVEPEPTVYARLVGNLDLNKAWTADRVVPIRVAGFNLKGFMLPGPLDPGNWGGTGFEYVGAAATILGHVPCVPLDQLWWLYGDRVSLVKVDAQGCDGMVLRGLERTLKSDHPAIVFEWEGERTYFGESLDSTWRWLQMLGYHVHEWPTHPGNYLAIWRGDRA